MPRSLRTGLLLLLLALSSGCKVWNESSAPAATPAPGSAAPATSAAATATVPPQTPAPTVRRTSPALRPRPTASRTAVPVVHRTLVPPPGPPPPGLPPYEAPTVAATRFLGCPVGEGGGWTFTAEVDLAGGSHWMPSTANLQQHTSGDTYRYVMQHIGNGPSAPPAPAEQVTWRDVALRGSDGSFHDLVFPAAKVIRASCPT